MLTEDEESQISPLLSEKVSALHGTTRDTSRSPQLSLWEYHQLSHEIIDDGFITPTSFHGTTYCNLHGTHVGLSAVFIVLYYVALIYVQTSNAFLKGMVILSPFSLPAILICLLIYLWLYFNRHGPIEYSNLLLRTWICKNDLRLIYVLLQLGNYHLICKEYESALSICEQAFNLPLTEKHVFYFLVVSRFKVRILIVMKRFEEASQCMVEIIEKEIKFAKKPLPVSYLKKDFNQLARLQTKLGRYDEAVQVYEKIVKLLEEGKFENHVDMGNTYVDIGQTEVLLGRSDQALVMFQKGLDIFRLNYGEFPKVTSMAKLHESIGDIFQKKNEMVLAKEHYEIALEVFRRSGRSESDRLVVKLMGKMSDMKAHS